MSSTDQVLMYGDEVIPYSVRRSSTRTNRIQINVLYNGNVSVDAPNDATDVSIKKAVSKRSRWIVNHVADAKERFSHVLPREYVSGESVLYLGKRYMLKVMPDKSTSSSVKLLRGQLLVRSNDTSPDNVKANIRAWYRVRAQSYYQRRLNALVDQLPFAKARPAFQLKLMEKRWGSCSVDGNLVLNPFLIKAPRDCIDYVLTHELCHLVEHNHSGAFFKLLDQHCVDWRTVKAQLDNMAEVIFNE